MRRFYYHSVWFDVFGVVLFGAVLLGGAGYLLYHAGGAASTLGGGGAIASGGGPSVPFRPGSGRSVRRSAPSPGPTSLFGAGRAAVPSGSGAEAPFSSSWREQATPALTAPSGDESSAPTGGGSAGRVRTEPFGPAIASRGPFASSGSGQVRPGNRNAGSGWRAEARRLAGRSRALSRQLGQMVQDGAGTETASSKRAPSKGETAVRSAAGVGARASSGPGTPGGPDRRDDPGSPSSVPIDDHLHWLMIAGILWGVWHLHPGG